MAFTPFPTVEPLEADVLAALLNERTPLHGYASTTTTVNGSTTLVNVAGVSCAVPANATFHFDLFLTYTSNATADIKIGWTFPTGLTMTYGGVGYDATGTLLSFAGQTQSTTPALGGGTGNTAHLHGRILVGSTAGTLQLQMAQNTSNASNTVVEVGTLLVLLRLA